MASIPGVSSPPLVDYADTGEGHTTVAADIALGGLLLNAICWLADPVSSGMIPIIGRSIGSAEWGAVLRMQLPLIGVSRLRRIGYNAE